MNQLPTGFYVLIAGQFLSAVADNALLLVTMALLQTQGYSAFWIPVLKLVFTSSYVIFGPWVGYCADRWPKPLVMVFSNGIKFLACFAMFYGANAIVAFSLCGLGAAIYAPARYGWITEVVPAEDLVGANAWIEICTVGAALLGIGLGGFLVGDYWRFLVEGKVNQQFGAFSNNMSFALISLCAIYILSTFLNFKVPDSGVRHKLEKIYFSSRMLQLFWQDQRALWNDPLGSTSLSVTTIFWGLGALMQLLVLAWAQERLHLSLEHAAYLQAATAVGVILGAIAASWFIPLKAAPKVLPLGIILGLMLSLMMYVLDIKMAVITTAGIGFIGGIFVVPMNALLQHRGVLLLTAGRSISVQNTCENASILIFLTMYSILLYLRFDLSTLTIFVGLVVAVAMTFVTLRYNRLQRMNANSLN